MAVNPTDFFSHVDSFINYRREIFEASDQTIKTNTIDLNLFENFVKERNYQAITGPVVMDYQYYLKTKN